MDMNPFLVNNFPTVLGTSNVGASLVTQLVKNLSAMQKTRV